jgi:hypothetical protein
MLLVLKFLDIPPDSNFDARAFVPAFLMISYSVLLKVKIKLVDFAYFGMY